MPWRDQGESWRFTHHSWRHYPFCFQLRSNCFRKQMDFDATLEFLGEGSWTFMASFWICLLILPGAYHCFHGLQISSGSGLPFGQIRPRLVGFRFARFVGGWCLFGLCLAACFHIAQSHGGTLLPCDARDRARAASRPRGSVGRAPFLTAQTDCRLWFESLLVQG